MNAESPKPESLEYQILITFLNQHTPKKPKEIAVELGKRASTINSALKRMQDNGILHWHHYGNVELLANGKLILEDINRHLEHIETFLKNTLDLSAEDARIESKQLAPHFSCAMINKICSKYGCHSNNHNIDK